MYAGKPLNNAEVHKKNCSREHCQMKLADEGWRPSGWNSDSGFMENGFEFIREHHKCGEGE